MFKDNIFKKVNKVVCLFATLYSLLSPWDSPGKNTGVGCHFLIQGIFPTQGANPAFLCLLHWQVDFFSPSISSVAQSCMTMCDPMECNPPGLPVYHQLPEITQLMSIETMMLSNHPNLCHHLHLPPSIFLSIRLFSNKSVLHIRRSKYWSFSFNIIPSNEYSGLISFRIDWLELPVVQGTLKSLLQHHCLKA